MKARLGRILAAASCGAAAVLALFAPVARATPHTVPDTMAQRVLACTPCHGKEGVATAQGYFPRIAGKPAGYLYNQLLNFREGRRNNAAMGRLTENLSDAYLMEIASYFAALDLPYPAPASVRPGPAQELSRGKILVTQGDATQRLPACTRCHGDAMTGVAPAIPGLLGLSRDYLLAQIGAWRTGLRRARAPDCMNEIGRRLTAQDLSAVVTYLALQPVPLDSAPAPAPRGSLPMDCGSVAQ
jgi:cytochrome c553